MIANREAFLWMLNNTYRTMKAGTYRGRETEAGVRMAIEYLEGLEAERLSEKEIKHVCRICYYRGRVTDHRMLTTA